MIHVACGLEMVVMQVGKFHACDSCAMQPLVLCAPHLRVFSPGRGISSPRAGWRLLLHPSATHGFTSASAEVMPLLPSHAGVAMG